MKRNLGAWPFVLVGGGLLAWAVLELFRRYPMLPPPASAEARFVDSAWNGLLLVEAVVYGLVIAFVFYCLVAFRAKDEKQEGEATAGSRGRVVETAWILASTLLTLGLAAFGVTELRAVVGDPRADIDVEVRGSQFSWEFYYPKHEQFGTKLFLERGARHRIILSSNDVVHSFWVPAFRLKQDAVPGKVVHLLLTPTEAGDYELMCSELCGWGHTEMTAQVEVIEPGTLESRLKGEF